MTTDPAAMVLLKEGLTSFDAAKMIKDLLDKNWDTEVSSKPKLWYAEDSKFVTFRSGDQVVIYIVSEKEDPVTIGYDFVNHTAVVTLDFYTTNGTREHLVKLIEEARRIILAHRVDSLGTDTNISGRVWMKWGVRIASFDKTTKMFRRRAIDIEINWRFREVVA